MLRSLIPVIGGLALLAAGALPVAAQTATGDPATVLQQFIASVNRNDPAATQASFFSDDAVVLGGPCGFQGCVGKSQVQASLGSGDPTQVTVTSLQPTGAGGNVLLVRAEERFSLPPQATAAGVQRFVEAGTVIVNNGKISRMSLQPDLQDQQTVTLLRIFSTLGPPPGSGPSTPSSAPGVPVAKDGQTLATQPAATQIQFLYVFGDRAGAEWVRQHNAALG